MVRFFTLLVMFGFLVPAIPAPAVKAKVFFCGGNSGHPVRITPKQ